MDARFQQLQRTLMKGLVPLASIAGKVGEAIDTASPHSETMENQITDFLERGIIMVSDHEEGEFISNVFLCEKKDGLFKMILNLKDLNQFIPYHHLRWIILTVVFIL